MWPFGNKEPKRSPGTRYIMKFVSHDRFTVAEFCDSTLHVTLLDIRRENGVFFLETYSCHDHAVDAVTKRMELKPFDTFCDFFTQLEDFCGAFSLEQERLKSDYRLMCFLSLYKFIFLQGSDQRGAEHTDGNVVIIEGVPHMIRNGEAPQPITWEEIKMLAEASRHSTGLWLRGLDGSNWEAYTFELYPWWRPAKIRRATEWFFRDTRDETSIWKDFVMNMIVRDRETGAYYFSHEVADGYGGDHYPRWIYQYIPVSAEAVARWNAAGLLEPGPNF